MTAALDTEPIQASDFVAPADGEYFLHLKDVRGMEGRDFAYRLTIREATPDYQLSALRRIPIFPKGGSTPVTVSVAQTQGYEGSIDIEVKGLPAGVTASPAKISAGQTSTVVVLSSAPDASLDTHPSPIEFAGHAKVNGQELIESCNARMKTRLRSCNSRRLFLRPMWW